MEYADQLFVSHISYFMLHISSPLVAPRKASGRLKIIVVQTLLDFLVVHRGGFFD